LHSWSASEDDSEPTVLVPSMLVIELPSPPPVGLLLELLLEPPPVAELLPPLELPPLAELPPDVELAPLELAPVADLPPAPELPPPEPLVPLLLQAMLAMAMARPTAFTSVFVFLYMGISCVSAAGCGGLLQRIQSSCCWASDL
jgi:hypothetical protein